MYAEAPAGMRIVSLFAHNPRAWTGAGNHTYLLQTSRPTLIDAGEGVPAHLDALAAATADRALAQVLVTHAHPDHAAGVTAIAARWPGAGFAKLPWPEADGRYDVPWRWLRDGELVDAGGIGLLVLHTPGHSPDHVCLFEPDSGVLFGGDLVVNGGTVVIPAIQPAATLRPPGPRSSSTVMTSWIGTTAPPTISGSSAGSSPDIRRQPPAGLALALARAAWRAAARACTAATR